MKLADEAVADRPAAGGEVLSQHRRDPRCRRRRGAADAVHPGYGFLAENAGFAEAVENAGLVFVGPRAETIRLMGDKVAARQAAIAAGVPTVPGSDGRIDDPTAARAIVERTGFPVMIKAAAGGGGRGIRVASDLEEFERLMPQASAEAQAAFGDGGLYLEKVIERARHIEVQVLGDGERVIHCFERECSLQRRRQKVWEEAPSPVLPDDIRQKLCASAVALAEAVDYRGAGTLEYLYDDADPRLLLHRDEHPHPGRASGDRVHHRHRPGARDDPHRRRRAAAHCARSDVRRRGHAIEVRINAEDPARNFMPRPGTVSELRVPGGHGVRFDTLLYAGYTIPPFYDSLLGKLIVWDETRAARDRAAEARAAGAGDRRRAHDQGACTRRWPPMPTVVAAQVRHALAGTLAGDRMRRAWRKPAAKQAREVAAT